MRLMTRQALSISPLAAAAAAAAAAVMMTVARSKADAKTVNAVGWRRLTPG